MSQQYSDSQYSRLGSGIYTSSSRHGSREYNSDSRRGSRDFISNSRAGSQLYGSAIYSPPADESAPLIPTINGDDDFVIVNGEEEPSITYASAKMQKKEPKSTKQVIRIVLLTVVMQSVGFTLVLPSMYLYLSSVCYYFFYVVI